MALFLLAGEAACAGAPSSASDSAEELTATQHRRATVELAITTRSCEDSTLPGSHSATSPWPTCSTGDFRFSLDVDVDDAARTITITPPFGNAEPVTQTIAPDGSFVVDFDHFFTYEGTYFIELPTDDTTGARDVEGILQAHGNVRTDVVQLDSWDVRYRELHSIDGSPLVLSEITWLDNPVSGRFE
jgi:hypothetical protein